MGFLKRRLEEMQRLQSIICWVPCLPCCVAEVGSSFEQCIGDCVLEEESSGKKEGKVCHFGEEI
jgi:hypothetical protein